MMIRSPFRKRNQNHDCINDATKVIDRRTTDVSSFYVDTATGTTMHQNNYFPVSDKRCSSTSKMTSSDRCSCYVDTSSITKKEVAVVVAQQQQQQQQQGLHPIPSMEDTDGNGPPCLTPFTPPPSFDTEQQQPGDDDDDEEEEEEDSESVVSDITMHFEEKAEEGKLQTKTVNAEQVFHHQEGTPPQGAFTDQDHVDDSSTNNKYGYEDAAPTTATEATFSPTIFKMPRRSSLKTSCIGEDQQRRRRMIQRRRASIGACEEIIQVKLHAHNHPVTRRRSISFHNDVVVHQVPTASSLAGSADALWINDEEYDEIQNKVLQIVETVRLARDGAAGGAKASTPSTLKYCSRGLERLLMPEIVQLKKMQAVECVMHEQFLQREMGDYDEEILANIYKYSTMRSQLEACKRAGNDAKEAEEYLRPHRTVFAPHRRASM
jgi:hypothetical protein